MRQRGSDGWRRDQNGSKKKRQPVRHRRRETVTQGKRYVRKRTSYAVCERKRAYRRKGKRIDARKRKHVGALSK